MISSYEEKNENYLFTAIDVDLNKDLCKRFEITSIPSIIILFKGKEVRRCNGMILTSAFKSALADIYNKYKEKK